MLTQFRARYPKGSLLTDLLAIDRGQYIVRCLVQVEGITLTTGLAAAATVELAEDQARNRALVALGMDSTTPMSHPEVPTVIEQAPTQPPPSPPQSFSPETVESTPTQPTKPKSSRKANNHVKSTPLPQSRHDEVEEYVPTKVLTVEEMPAIADFSTTELATEEVKSLETTVEIPPLSYPSELTTDTESLTQSDTPIDFSDIIARTNVELKRLGWTNQQGRDYLIQTYGKRSRQLLTDEELIDFLHHLELEPTPE